MSEVLKEETLIKLQSASATLAPLFAADPVLESEAVGELYGSLAAAEASALAEEWPLVPADQALPLLEALVAGAGENQREALAQEYRRLFVGPGTKAAPPWGSVYTDQDMVVFGESTLALREWLRQNAIAVAVAANSEEPEDSMGTMLYLLAWIAQEKPELLGEYLQLHLLPWGPHFLEVMEQAAQLPFYKALAVLTKKTLLGAGQEMSLEVKIPKFYR